MKIFIPFIFSALFLILPYSNGQFWLTSWVGFIPLFMGLRDKSVFKAFILTYISGIIFWAGTVYWLIHVTGLGLLFLVLYLALYWGIFGASLTYFYSQRTRFAVILIPALWVILEYLRSNLLTGFGWALLGYSQCLNLGVIQFADIFGVWGVSFLIMMVNVGVFRFVCKHPARTRRIFLPIICLTFALSYGQHKLSNKSSVLTRQPLKVSIIQGNIPQELKWNSGTKDFIINKYLNISNMAVKDKPDLIVWPEAALPVVLEDEPVYYGMVERFCRQNNMALLFGAVTRRDNNYYNSALLVSGRSWKPQRYDKLHLVPFGEYVPLRKLLPFLNTIVPIGEISPGKNHVLFEMSNAANTSWNRFGVLICFEDVFPGLARDLVKNGADFLINITNDAWYMQSAASFQHSQSAIFRAVENRVFVVRSANTGISEFISSLGQTYSMVSDSGAKLLFIDGYATGDVAGVKDSVTTYTRYGDWFVLFCVIIIIIGLLKSRFRHV